MKKLYILLFFPIMVFSQVGINTTNPNAQLEIQSSNQAAPANTDGLLIPKINTFPATNPTVAQQGMLVYLTSTVGLNTPGFYYWDNPTTSWVPIGNNNNSGWNLDGNAITAGQFIGTTNNEDIIFRRNGSNSGRVGTTHTSFGSSVNLFGSSTTSAFGATALQQNSGSGNSAFGYQAIRAVGNGSFNSALGLNTLRNNSSGSNNTALGNSSLDINETGNFNTGIGSESNVASSGLNNATAIGANAQVSASNSLVLGSINGVNGATADVNVGIGTTQPLNKLHLHTNSGNLNLIQFSNSGSGTSATDGFLIGINSTGEAGIINTFGGRINFNDQLYIDGDKLGIGASNPTEKLHIVGSLRMVDGNEAVGRVMVSNANGTATWTDNTAVASGTLDQAYDFGGTGNGNTITADNGAVLINGTDGLISTGISGSGAFAPSGAGIKMYWNPRKAAFRAGQVSGTQWDDGNIGSRSTAFGLSTIASGSVSTAFGTITTASGTDSTAFGSFTTASGPISVAFGQNTTASAQNSTAFGQSTVASGIRSTAFGLSTVASGSVSTAFGIDNSASGLISTAFGIDNSALSFGETVLGIGSTTYTPSTNGFAQFRSANATDRLFVIGNAIDVNNNSVVDDAERSDAMVVLKNGNVGFGTSSPEKRLHIANTGLSGGISNGNTGFLLESNTDVYQHFLTPNANESGLLFGSDTASIHGGIIFDNSDQDLSFRTGGNTTRMTLASSGNLGLGTATPSRNIHVLGNSASTTNGQLYLEQSGTGDAIIHIGNTGARHYNLGLDTSTENFKIATHATTATSLTSSTLVTVQPTGEVGVGTTTPDQKLHVSGPAGLTAIKITNTSTGGATSNVALDFQRGGNANTDWRIYNIGPNLTIANSGDELTTINDLYQFQINRFMPMNDGVINLGQTGNKWNTLFALNGTINTSDLRQKKNIQNITYGLQEVLQLRPVSFEWKKDDGSGTKLGLIAQELQQVLPEVVRDWDWEEDELGNRKKVAASILGVYYSDLIPVLIKATQEQQHIIENQNNEITNLKSELNALQTSVRELISRIKTIETSKN